MGAAGKSLWSSRPAKSIRSASAVQTDYSTCVENMCSNSPNDDPLIELKTLAMLAYKQAVKTHSSSNSDTSDALRGCPRVGISTTSSVLQQKAVYWDRKHVLLLCTPCTRAIGCNVCPMGWRFAQRHQFGKKCLIGMALALKFCTGRFAIWCDCAVAQKIVRSKTSWTPKP